MTTTTTPRPSDPVFNLAANDLCLSVEEGIYGEVQDWNRPRATAIGNFAREAGCDFREVRCVKRWAKLYTRQDVWDGPGRDRWIDDACFGIDGERVLTYTEAAARAPVVPPASWQPSEYDGCWWFCGKDTTGAFPVWVCEVKGQEQFIGTDRDHWQRSSALPAKSKEME